MNHRECDSVSDPTTCGRCGADLTRGWSERWSGKTGKTVEVVCFDCDLNEREVNYRRTRRLTGKIMTAAILGAFAPELNQEIKWALGGINAAIKSFEDAVWFGGLQSTVRDTRERGFSGNKDSIEWLVRVCAGRCVITLQRGTRSVTVMCIEDSKRSTMGLHDLDAKALDAVRLLQSASQQWPVKLTPDEKVKFW